MLIPRQKGVFTSIQIDGHTNCIASKENMLEVRFNICCGGMIQSVDQSISLKLCVEESIS